MPSSSNFPLNENQEFYLGFTSSMKGASTDIDYNLHELLKGL
jgi:hypothetical protein